MGVNQFRTKPKIPHFFEGVPKVIWFRCVVDISLQKFRFYCKTFFQKICLEDTKLLDINLMDQEVWKCIFSVYFWTKYLILSQLQIEFQTSIKWTAKWTRTTIVVSNGRYTFYQIHFIKHNSSNTIYQIPFIK